MSQDLLCPYCHDHLERAIVLCQRCETPHHEECFVEHGQCTQLQCLSHYYTPIDEAHKARVIGPRPKTGSVLGAVASLLFGVVLASPLLVSAHHGCGCGGAEIEAAERAEARMSELEEAWQDEQLESAGAVVSAKF